MAFLLTGTADYAYFDSCAWNDHGKPTIYNTPTVCEVTNSYFNTGHYSDTGSFDISTVLRNCTFVDPYKFYSTHNNLLIEGNTFQWLNRNQDFELIWLLGTNCTVTKNKFYGFHYGGIWAYQSTDTTISENYFDQGVTSSRVTCGVRTHILNNYFENVHPVGTYALRITSGSDCWLVGNYFGINLVNNIDRSRFSNISGNTNYP